MTLAEAVSRKVTQLPVSQQLQVLSFVESLRMQAEVRPRRDPEGILEGAPSGLDLEDFAEARRDAWHGLPREIGK